VALSGLIFDVDGVLVDTVPLHYAAWQRMFAEYGYPFDERTYRERVDGKSRLDGVRGVMGEVPGDVVVAAGNRKQACYLELLEATPLAPFPDVTRFLERIAGRGYRLAAASSSRNAPAVLARIGLLDRMEAVVTGADVTEGKPAPDIFLAAARRLGLAPAECVVFEDAAAGVAAAKRGGFPCVAVARAGISTGLAAADLVVRSFDEVDPDVLEGRGG